MYVQFTPLSYHTSTARSDKSKQLSFFKERDEARRGRPEHGLLGATIT